VTNVKGTGGTISHAVTDDSANFGEYFYQVAAANADATGAYVKCTSSVNVKSSSVPTTPVIAA